MRKQQEPIAAILGLRKGWTLKWKVPAGLKTFQILEVRRPVRT